MLLKISVLKLLQISLELELELEPKLESLLNKVAALNSFGNPYDETL